MKVVLIGYRASGKSTIGRLLAEALSMEFVDIDHLIMAEYGGKSVADIWAEFGEPHYRETESKVTEIACQRDGLVIALGGGTPMQPRAYSAIEKSADTHRIFLSAPASVLYQRSLIDSANTENRPAFSDERSGLEEVEHMLAMREPVFRRLADMEVDVGTQSLQAAGEQILKIVRG